MATRPGGWTGFCPGEACRRKLAAWSEALVGDGVHSRASVEKGFERCDDGIYRKRGGRPPLRGRQLAAIGRRAGAPMPRYGQNRGESIDWGSVIQCDECQGHARVCVPRAHGGECRVMGCPLRPPP